METEVWRAAYPETLGETLGPRFDLVSDLVLVQLENPGKPTNHKFAAERKQVVQKPLSLLMPGKTSNQSLESAGGAKQTSVWKLYHHINTRIMEVQITHQSFGYLVL